MDTVLGTAATQWSDYLGTAAADDADVVIGTPSLYELADLSREDWTIVAVDLIVTGTSPSVAIHAARRPESTAPEDDLDVTTFRLTEPWRVETFIEAAFKQLAIRLVAKPFADRTLRVAPE